MKIINISEAKQQLSHLIQLALNGEEVVIAKHGYALVKLSPYHEKQIKRKGGQLKGMITIAENFDAPLPSELLKVFNGE